MTMRDITAKEWRFISCWRGRTLTGFNSHSWVYDGKDYTYYWPMGMQPPQNVLVRIAHRNPLKAAKLFLAFYFKASGVHHEGRGYTEPRPRSTPKAMHVKTYA